MKPKYYDGEQNDIAQESTPNSSNSEILAAMAEVDGTSDVDCENLADAIHKLNEEIK